MLRIGGICLALLALGGCPTEQPQLELGPIIETTIPPGVYTGEIRIVIQTIQDGEVTDEQTVEDTFNETFGASGLPIIASANSPPRENLVLSSSPSGLGTTQRVTSVSFEGNRLTIVLETTIQSGLQRLTGEETVTYDLLEDGALEYRSDLGVSSVRADGRFGGITWTATGTMQPQ